MTARSPLSGTDWDPLLGPEFTKAYWVKLQAYLDDERRSCIPVCPPEDKVYAAFHLTQHADTKVVILGQDPYPGEGQAHGLAFSVRCDVRKLPLTLQNIRRELRTDLGGEVSIPEHGSLAPWARSGVLLLNTVLTVRQGKARSHEGKGWERFTDRVIETVNEKPDRVVFILWGRLAQRKRGLIDGPQHKILESSHPSRLSARKPSPVPFLGSKPFSEANAALSKARRGPVDWNLGPCC